jgi:hypothetical protein
LCRVLFSEAARREGGDNNDAAPEMMGPILRSKKSHTSYNA